MYSMYITQDYVQFSGDAMRQGVNLTSAAYNPMTMVKFLHFWGSIFLYAEWTSLICLTVLLSTKDTLQCLMPPSP